MTANAPDEFDALKSIIKTLEPFNADDQKRMLRWVAEKLGLTVAPAISPSTVALPIGVPVESPQSPKSRTDIKTFVADKKPKNDSQFAAVVAYYYQFEAVEKKTSITKDDLLEACRLAGYPRPPTPGQTLLNALNAGLLDKAERASFTISSVGENLVAITLPGDGAPSAQSRRKAGRKASAKKSAKKATSKKAANKAPVKEATPKNK